MITEIVLFDLPKDISPEQIGAVFRQGAPGWQANTELMRKNYLYDRANGRAGAVYLWPDIGAAQRAHDQSWCEMIRTRFGSAPTFQYFETPVVVDNVLGRIVEAEPASASANA